jgi:hypothetical protein
MDKVFLADPIWHASQIRDIFWECLEWANKEYGELRKGIS